ncbi:MAG: glycan-binding surface protein [Chitinophagaceae bacterium]
MKQTILMMLMAFVVVSIYSSCDKEDVANGGEPKVDYIRVTDPASSDSLLAAAGQGRLIAIIGQNLDKAVEIWFNDQRATLTPTYITNTSILVSVPSVIPETITNKIRIVFSNGKELLHDFNVSISKPTITSMLSEYVNEGDVATIQGNYFYAPVMVTFTGGVTGEIVEVEDEQVMVRIPAGALPGPITIKTNFGETESDFWFRDNRNMFITGDPHEGWWGSYLVTSPGPGAPSKINGNYYRMTKLVKNYTWDSPELAGGPASSMPTHSKNIPDAAITKPEDYYLKFEINTLKPYNANNIRINVGLTTEDNDNYTWQPPYDSKGQWNTIVIPFEDVIASYRVRPVVNPDGYWSRILVFGPGELNADIAFDNFRVVPKIID